MVVLQLAQLPFYQTTVDEAITITELAVPIVYCLKTALWQDSHKTAEMYFCGILIQPGTVLSMSTQHRIFLHSLQHLSGGTDGIVTSIWTSSGVNNINIMLLGFVVLGPISLYRRTV